MYKQRSIHALPVLICVTSAAWTTSCETRFATSYDPVLADNGVESPLSTECIQVSLHSLSIRRDDAFFEWALQGGRDKILATYPSVHSGLSRAGDINKNCFVVLDQSGNMALRLVGYTVDGSFAPPLPVMTECEGVYLLTTRYKVLGQPGDICKFVWTGSFPFRNVKLQPDDEVELRVRTSPPR